MTVYIHNYSWLHASLWSLLSRVLPRSALDKVVFTSNHEPLESFFFSAKSSVQASLAVPRPCALGKTLRVLDSGDGDNETRSSGSFVSALSQQVVPSDSVSLHRLRGGWERREAELMVVVTATSNTCTAARLSS